MGTRGPVPKRSNERRRRNVEGRAEKATVVGSVTVPGCPKGAHPIARRWYVSLRQSGQSQFFEPSDWAGALLLVEQLTRALRDDKAIAGPVFASLWAAMGEFGTTEGARRRMRIEIERLKVNKPEDVPGITAIEDFRRRMAQ